MVTKPAKNLQQVRTAIHEGELPQARRLLRQLLREDPRNHTAWLLLAKVTQSPQAALEYVKRAERLQPDSYIALRVRSSLEQKRREESKRVGRITWWPVTIGMAFMGLLVFLATWFVPSTTWNQVAALKSDNNFNIGVNSIASATPKAHNQVIIATIEAPLSQPTATARPTVTIVPLSAYSELLPPIEGINQELIAGVTNEEVGEAVVAHAQNDIPDAEAILSAQSSVTDDAAVEVNQPAIVDPTGLRPNGIGADERWIDVDLNTQNLVAYEGNTPVFYSLISSGTWEFPTVTGQFRTWMKYESQDMNGYLLGYDYYLTNVPYVMYFYGDFAIHGTYWHNNFGVPMSHGCVNMNPMDAGWLYNWAPLGTMVNIHY
jgi:lipoprotein-anchoring transpeptidase ErfK/SrfK